MTTIHRIKAVNKREKKRDAKRIANIQARQFNHKVTVRLNDEQYRAISRVCGETGMTTTEVIRYTLFRQRKTPDWVKWIDSTTAVNKRHNPRKLSDEQLDAIKGYTTQLKKLGNNINQIARVINQNHEIKQEKTLVEKLIETNDLLTEAVGELDVLHQH